ncbi:hypothetical protein PybrP1_004469 [[Pythium] brassicae (nom. inval.)]|nr:hypothetical protein PybrP1_004469 [[Pythium] brassicae (nom. inval.)]
MQLAESLRGDEYRADRKDPLAVWAAAETTPKNPRKTTTTTMVRAALAVLLPALLAAPAAGLSSSPPSLYDYKYDGKTTYCYAVDQGLDVQNLDFAYVRVQASGSDCPVTLSISRSAGPGALLPLADTEFEFTATLNLASNAFNLHALPTYVPAPITGRPVQIGHANVHTCSRTTVCDVFRTGSARKITEQESANFTGDAATFRQKFAFDRGGEYNVFAHIIIPPANPQNSSYHFITFMTATVAATGAGAADSGLSTATIIGVVVGGVAVVLLAVLAIVFCKRTKPADPGDDMFRSSGGGFMPTLTTKTRSGVEWQQQPESEFRIKDSYHSTRTQSEFFQPPGLSASALAFHERLSSRQPKTASSSGSFRDGGASPKASDGGYGGFGSPAAAAPGSHHSHVRSGHHGPPHHHSSGNMSGGYYSGGGGGFHNPELNDFRIPSAIINSFESDNSMGTSLGFNADSHYHYTPYHGGGGGNGDAPHFDRESDLSSLGDDDEIERRRQRAQTGELKTLDEGRLSDVSVATVDFTLHRPQPPRAMQYQALDESGSNWNSVRSTDTFNFHDTANFAPSTAPPAPPTSSFQSVSRPAPPSASATTKGAVDPREARTLSDGESYEF